MPSTEAQRTLVKSPPELWAELSNPSSLARHLSDFGEIRIARAEPEQSVEWETDAVTGTVQLKPSGWGTKVTLTIVREAPEPEAAVAEPEPEAAVAEPKLEAAVAEPAPGASSEPAAFAETAVESGTAAEESLEPLPATRRSRFFARLFRRRRARAIALERPPAVEHEPEQPQPASEEQEPPDLAVELAQVEEAIAEQDAALLAAVLDRLGAAHHRPFSRG